MPVVYEFWRYDFPTELVRDLLEEFKIPYKEKVFRLKRHGLYGQPYDEWTRIHVDTSELLGWLGKEIEKRLNEFGNYAGR